MSISIPHLSEIKKTQERQPKTCRKCEKSFCDK